MEPLNDFWIHAINLEDDLIYCIYFFPGPEFAGDIPATSNLQEKSPLQVLPVETVQRSPIESGLREQSILMGYLN